MEVDWHCSNCGLRGHPDMDAAGGGSQVMSATVVNLGALQISVHCESCVAVDGERHRLCWQWQMKFADQQHSVSQGWVTEIWCQSGA